MRIFITGATGFIGSALVPELLQAGHQVLGLTRSDAGAQALTAAGAEVHRGTLEDLESLQSGASKADAVIHCAFDHDFSNFAAICEKDKKAIEALGAALAGSGRTLIVSGGLAGWAPGQTFTENDEAPTHAAMPRVSEQTVMSLQSHGVVAGVVRLSQIHNTVKQGLVTYLIGVAREKGISAYIGEGKNRWAAAHVTDVARLYRLAVENHTPGARYHAVAEEGVMLRDIAEAIGQGLNLPVVSLSTDEAAAHFGFLGMFAGSDITGSSAITKSKLGWQPTGPSLLADLKQMQFAAV